MFKNNKKAQGLSINTIIIAAIAVVVLVVLVAILTGRLGMFTGALGTEGDAAKQTDSILNKCIPEDGVYRAISAADAETKEERIKEKARQLNVCKNRNQDDCSGDCQWVG